jgi:hypothetical protein
MLLDKGLLGLAVVVLGGVVVFLYRDNAALRRELTVLARETATGLANSSASIVAMTTETGELTRKVERILDATTVIVPGLDGLARQVEANGSRMDRLLDAAARGSSR